MADVDGYAQPGTPGGGPKSKRHDWNAIIQVEMDKWNADGIDPVGVPVHGFFLDTKVKALVMFLIEKGLIDKEELEDFHGKVLLETLQVHRAEIVMAARAQNSNLAVAKKQLLGPDGRPA
jgi:hypothetical protein